jgi:hypothetical protein
MHVEDIESIGASGYLGKKAMMMIPNFHDSVLDLHTRTALIQLSQADDRVPQRGDVVDSGEQSVLTRLGGADDRADAFDLHTGGIPKLDGASDIGVKLSEELPSVLSLLEPLPRRVCALGSSRWRRAVTADAAGDNSMLACARSRAGSSSSICATWVWSHRGCRHSLAQWASLSQLWQAPSRAGFWLPAAPPWALPSAHPCAPAWAPPCDLCRLPRLRPPVEGGDSPFFPSLWQTSHCFRVRCSFLPTLIGPKRGCGSSPLTTLR